MSLRRTYRTLPINVSAGHTKLANILNDTLCSNGVAMTILYEYPLSKLGSDELADEYGVVGMSVDFYIQELNMAVEYQGEQHYKPSSLFGDKQMVRDGRKRRYLKDLGVTLIEIPDNIKELNNENVLQKLGLS